MLTPFWAEYARVQHLVELGKSRDEQLDAFLEVHFDRGEPFDAHQSRRRLLNLHHNLKRKDRARAALLARASQRADPRRPESPVIVTIQREMSTAVRLAAGDDWSLLHSTLGGDYAGVAAAQGVAVGTVKSRVSRTREKLKPLLRGWI